MTISKHSGTESIIQDIMAGKVASTRLITDQRVLSRITDGIYRQTSSALRELVANAYDADATNVVIQTDLPRFSEIRVRDNGIGMNADTLAYLIHSIGGSSKRTQKGKDLGVTDPANSSLSPKGRKLIGKIGIGLFSVAHLSRSFRIITKRSGEPYRLVADIILHFHLDEDIEAAGDNFQAGEAQLWRIPAEDIDAQGTEIIVRDIVPKVRDELRSLALWKQINTTEEEDRTEQYKPPLYHIGQVNTDDLTIAHTAHLPWTEDNTPEERFKLLVESAVNYSGTPKKIPELKKIFDNYLNAMWTLSLSIPVDYVDKHPFDITNSDDIFIYQVLNPSKSQATELNLQPSETVRQRLQLLSPIKLPKDSFQVLMDDVELLRPQPLLRMPKTQQAIPKPILFVGSYDSDFSDTRKEFSGGPLQFEGYLLWTHVVTPKENTGILIRIHEASGTLFDRSFLQYQGGEDTRAGQTTAEIFVLRGLESALNIDRESFNFTHPHFQLITKWLHNAMRQEFNKVKQLTRVYQSDRQQQAQQTQVSRLESIMRQKIEQALERYGTRPDIIDFIEHGQEGTTEFSSDSFRIEINEEKDPFKLEKKKLLIELLAAYGLFGTVGADDIQNLYNDFKELF